MAITLDGRIAKDTDHCADWTEKADKKLFVHMTREAGVLIMGSKTYDTIGRPLPKRKNIVLTRDKTRVSEHPDLEFTDESPQKLLERLEKEGYQEVILAGGQKINTLFAQAKLIDEIVVTVAPLIFGFGLSLFDESIVMDLELKQVEPLGENSIMARYKVKK